MNFLRTKRAQLGGAQPVGVLLEMDLALVLAPILEDSFDCTIYTLCTLNKWCDHLLIGFVEIHCPPTATHSTRQPVVCFRALGLFEKLVASSALRDVVGTVLVTVVHIFRNLCSRKYKGRSCH